MKTNKKTREQLTRENEEPGRQAAGSDANAVLAASENRYRRLFETAQDGILILDAETGQIDDVNPFLIKLTGYSREDFLRKRLWDIGPFRDAAQSKNSFEELQNEEYIRYEDLPLETRDGRKIAVEFVSNVYLVDGKKVIQCNIRDITDRKRAEEALRESERKFRSYIDDAPDGVFIANELGNYVEVNPAACAMTGYSAEELTRLNLMDIVPPEAKEVTQQAFESVARTGKVHVEMPFVRKDGQILFWSVDAVKLTDSRYLAFTKDITDRRRAEEALQELNATLEKRVGQRTAELEKRATQLRALAAELAQAEERERERIAQVLHDHLQQLLVAAKLKMSSLHRLLTAPDQQTEADSVLDLLNLSIDASRSLTAELSPPVLHESGLAGGLKWLAKWMWDKYGLTVNVTVRDPVAPLSEDLRLMCFRAVRELLFNVVKHSGVTAAKVAMTRGPDKPLRIVVSDEGRGFDAAALADGNLAGGFGLFSIRERVAYLGGRLDIESAPGRGARFTLTVPTGKEVLRSQPPTAETPLPKGPISPPPAPGDIRVLIVDDHPVVRRGLVDILQKETGVAVVGEAADGEEALDQARALNPDVILMDVAMPLKSGVEATCVLSCEMPAVHVIGLSAHAEDEIAGQMRLAGAVGYLLKDGPIEDLLAAVHGASARL